MERKRKLPARAAARVEQVSKKRNSTPPDPSTTSTPPSALTSPQRAESVAQEPPPPVSTPLPKSLLPGQPLPTVEKPQPDDLSQKEFQSVQESGVMAESLSRSRQKWIHDGVFEKYWTKPTKRKGVVREDSNNPAKDTMTKIGQITITVEPHLLEATMYAVKEPRPTPTTDGCIYDCTRDDIRDRSLALISHYSLTFPSVHSTSTASTASSVLLASRPT
ncbi:hypothetical protein ONZ43_g3846 [Nemania bipapillata]|uniref:Uncharacterized protein n=1 Tax=Nemania bipapillata TaxID=110536 RepID=A0ACC2IVN4_9PEZI|nr:hypothetical protein ONZ43_g3846 [Nemania bipapillata]